MGCVQSSSDRKDKTSGGGGGAVIGTADGTGGNNAVADPRLPLNARQKYSMLASWKGIARALEPTGIYMFVKYISFFFFIFFTPQRNWQPYKLAILSSCQLIPSLSDSVYATSDVSSVYPDLLSPSSVYLREELYN